MSNATTGWCMRGAHEKETDVSLAQRVVWLSHWKKSGRVHRIVKFKFKMEFEPPPGRGAKYCDERVCMSICFSKATCPNFTKLSLHVTCEYRPWLGPSLTTVQYVMYFRFADVCAAAYRPTCHAPLRIVPSTAPAADDRWRGRSLLSPIALFTIGAVALIVTDSKSPRHQGRTQGV